MTDRLTGVCKWYDPKKGYGFIIPDNGEKDVFVHKSALEKSGIVKLFEGQKVIYEITDHKGRKAACNIGKFE